MRIAIDARELAGRPTGVGRYLAQIIRAWDELPGAAAHEFVLCAPEPIDVPASRLRMTTSVRPGRGTLWEQFTLPGLVREAGAHVLFAPAYTGPLRGSVPMVLTIHDVSFAAHPEWFSWREGLRRRMLTRLAARRAARVITVSDFSKREIERHLAIDGDRVEVIYSGVTALRATGAGVERRPLVLYVGSVFNRRHVPELIDAFARVAATRPDVRLEIVGDNRTTPRVDIERLVAASGASDRIRARAYVSDEELTALYRQASAFAFLSDYEGFGFTPLEALAAGVPAVVLDTAVAREIYGPAAVFIERPEPAQIAAALDRLLFDATERERLLSTSVGLLQRYSWSECAHRTLQVLIACAVS